MFCQHGLNVYAAVERLIALTPHTARAPPLTIGYWSIVPLASLLTRVCYSAPLSMHSGPLISILITLLQLDCISASQPQHSPEYRCLICSSHLLFTSLIATVGAH